MKIDTGSQLPSGNEFVSFKEEFYSQVGGRQGINDENAFDRMEPFLSKMQSRYVLYYDGFHVLDIPTSTAFEWDKVNLGIVEARLDVAMHSVLATLNGIYLTFMCEEYQQSPTVRNHHD